MADNVVLIPSVGAGFYRMTYAQGPGRPAGTPIVNLKLGSKDIEGLTREDLLVLQFALPVIIARLDAWAAEKVDG